LQFDDWSDFDDIDDKMYLLSSSLDSSETIYRYSYYTNGKTLTARLIDLVMR